MCLAMEDFAEQHASRIIRLRGLYAIVGDDDPVGKARAAIEGGAGVIQVRMKSSPASAILGATRQIVALAFGRALVIVNDRADLAVLAGADGVHVGDDDLPAALARRIVGPGMLLGRSTRTLAEARAAIADGADHVGFGPMFGTRTKEIAAPPRGLTALQELAAALPAPVVAIGGITRETIADVARAGAAAAAVIEDLFARGDVRERAERLVAGFSEGAGSRP
jgi:thiamine-phosphate pyrophosphorylase